MFEAIFLGTGAAVPTRFRSLSSTALVLNGRLLLFDCGEGTQRQLQKARLRPGRLSHIFISHFHGDHLYGLPGLLTSLQMSECRQPVRLYGPEGIREYVEFHSRVSHFRLGFPLEICEMPESETHRQWQEDGFAVECRRLAHRVPAFGWAIREPQRPGRFDAALAEKTGVPAGPERAALQRGEPVRIADGKVVSPDEVIGPPRSGHHFAYCLDTAPCEGAIHLARNADILVHDATFAPGEEAAAQETGHSTFTQAARVASEAGAQRLVLTHISSRYQPQECKQMLEAAREVFPEATLACDLMRIRVEYPD